MFNRNDAERYLLLASDLPGYTVRLTLRPADGAPGDVVGDVTVQRLAGYADINVQNGGAESLGPWGALLRGQLFGLTGLGDRTTVSVFTTPDLKEQQTVQLGHDFRLGSEGMTMGGTFTYAWARPTIPDASVLARTLLGTVEIGYPLVRREAETIRASAGMDFVNQDVDLDTLPLTRDRLRVGFLRLGFDAAKTDYGSAVWSAAEPPWRVSSLLELRQGLRILGATNCGPLGASCVGPGLIEPSRPEGQADATVLRYTVNGEVRPIPGSPSRSARAANMRGSRCSASKNSLPATIPPGAAMTPAHSLATGALEPRPRSALAAVFQRPRGRRRSKAMPSGTMLEVRNRDMIPSVISQVDELDFVGGGARINFDRFALDAAVAVPLTKLAGQCPPGPARAGLADQPLFPWSYR